MSNCFEMHTDAPSPIPEQDKAAVRDNIIEAIVRAPQAVRAQLGECLKSIVHADFPEQWPGLLPIVLHNLSSQVLPLLRTLDQRQSIATRTRQPPT